MQCFSQHFSEYFSPEYFSLELKSQSSDWPLLAVMEMSPEVSERMFRDQRQRKKNPIPLNPMQNIKCFVPKRRAVTKESAGQNMVMNCVTIQCIELFTDLICETEGQEHVS